MTEEEKGAPVWGEEPVKQSGEAAGAGEGLPGKAAAAAGTAAPERGGAAWGEVLCQAGQGQGARGRESGAGVFTQCSWVFLAFATVSVYNKS